jgi:hypothetical protein
MGMKDNTRKKQAKSVASKVVGAILRQAFDPSREDEEDGTEAAEFVYRMRREGLFVAPLDEEEFAVAPPSMVDPAVAEAADAVLVSAAEVCALLAAELAALPDSVVKQILEGLNRPIVDSGGRNGFSAVG